MRAATISLGLIATVLIAGCAAGPTQNSAQDAAVTTPSEATGAVAKPAPEQPLATQAAVVNTPAADAAADEIVCRNEKVLGTRISKRVCKTREQMRIEEAAAREMMKNRDQKSHGVTDSITGGG